MHKKSAVLKFIEKERAKGVGDQGIQHQLLDAGWHMDIIQNAMSSELSKSAPKPISSTAKKKLPVRQLQLLGIVLFFFVMVFVALFI